MERSYLKMVMVVFGVDGAEESWISCNFLSPDIFWNYLWEFIMSNDHSSSLTCAQDYSSDLCDLCEREGILINQDLFIA